jgi:lysyl oxidase
VYACERSAPGRAVGLACVLLIGLGTLTACTVPSEGLGILAGPQAAASPLASLDPSWLLPDLRVAAPQELELGRDDLKGERQMRFNTSVFNTGPGALKLTGRHDPALRRTTATQHIHRINGSTTTRGAGTFVFHPTHDHWHVEDFTSFELWTYGAGGRLERMLGTTGKMSFCIWDSRRMATQPRGAATRPVYERCPQDVQGLSVGWIDTYRARTPGQHLMIEGIPSGRYAIRSTVDPENHFVEANEGNNQVIAYVRLSSSTIRRIPAP